MTNLVATTTKVVVVVMFRVVLFAVLGSIAIWNAATAPSGR